MHALRDGRFRKTTTAVEATGEHYDVIIGGAGISGLALAFLFQQQFGASPRILLVENSEDFGGHARRNFGVRTAFSLTKSRSSSFPTIRSRGETARCSGV
jgi:cation diffusion facilitator CzcD-associated flavoprotein CzcO